MSHNTSSGHNGSTEDEEERVAINVEAIPEELKERDQWLMWDASADKPRRPHWRGDFSVGWNNPDDWHSFEEAAEAAAERDSWGIGYVFARSNEDYARGLYGALDLDGCVDEEGRPKEWLPSLQPFFDEDAYMELSPSGGGVHIPLVGFEPPEWWSNVFLSDDEHEGLEAYGSKFFTFTGDRLRNCGDSVADAVEFVEDWLIEASKSITGDDPTKTQTRSFEDASSGGRAHRDEFLEEDDIRDALEHINPDVDYNTWRDIGFALADFFTSDRRALSLFTDWSRSGSKWDRDAEKQAERIISDASSAGVGGRTIGTVIHHARNGGWEMPNPSKPPNPAKNGTQLAEDVPEQSETQTSELRDAQSSPEIDGEEGENWAAVRHWYEEEGKGTGRYCAANKLEERTSWMYVLESETLWVYDSETGYFSPWGEAYVSHVLESELGAFYSSTEVSEVVERLAARNQTHREELNAGAREGYYLCVGNGVVDLETGEPQAHSPDFKFTRGLQWDYDPERADPEPVLNFLDDITKREADRDTLLDHLAHGLMPGHPFRAFVMMYGPGANGKTQLGQIFRGFVGEDNAASVELQDLTGDDSFATGGLPGAFVNVGDDISVSEIRDVSILKSLTGSGTIRANEKYEKQYEFENEAAMFFSANEPPRIAEESAAVGDRLYPIEMPYRFVKDPSGPREKQKVPGISQDLLCDDEAMRGLLMLCVAHAQRLIEENGQYSMPESPSERRDMYEAASDPIRRFALEYLEDGESGDAILKDDAFAVYREMCEQQDERVASADGFKRQITQQSIVDVESARTRALTDDEGADACWRYVCFNESAREIMPKRLIARYFESAESGETAPEDDSSSGRAAFGAEPISCAAESLTGYVTVTAEIVTTQRLGDEGRGVKAVLKDRSGAIDAVAWDDTDADLLESSEGEFVVLENVEVTEYHGSRQLSLVEGLSELKSIQQGVGYTEIPETDSEDLGAVADGAGSTERDDSKGEVVDLRPKIVMFVRKNQGAKTVHQSDIVDAFTDRANEDKIINVISELCRKGRLACPQDHYYCTY